jgi:butyrate kinase
MNYTILTINPGSTSTKIAVYENEKEVFKESIDHSVEDLKGFSLVIDQFDFRLKAVLDVLGNASINLDNLDAVVGRGGFVKPIPSGTYLVNEQMVFDLKNPWKEHASNLGGLIARTIADSQEIEAYIVDPVVVDEMSDIARISGVKELARKSMFHALNHKATAKKVSGDLNLSYDQVNLIIAHMGGGITVGAHEKGRVIDVNNGLDGEGAFSPERAGSLPVGDLVRMCFSGEYKEAEIYKKVVGKGGFVSYLNTNDARKVEALAEEGNEEAQLIIEAMSYQVAKEIGAYATVLKGKVDGIVLTGGMAYSDLIRKIITERVSFIAPVYNYPGENEMESLALGGLNILTGNEEAKIYKS